MGQYRDKRHEYKHVTKLKQNKVDEKKQLGCLLPALTVFLLDVSMSIIFSLVLL